MGAGQRSLLTNLMVSSIPRTYRVENKRTDSSTCPLSSTLVHMVWRTHGVACTWCGMHMHNTGNKNRFRLKVLWGPKHVQLNPASPFWPLPPLLFQPRRTFFSTLNFISLFFVSDFVYTVAFASHIHPLKFLLSLGHFYQPSESSSSSSAPGIRPGEL